MSDRPTGNEMKNEVGPVHMHEWANGIMFTHDHGKMDDMEGPYTRHRHHGVTASAGISTWALFPETDEEARNRPARREKVVYSQEELSKAVQAGYIKGKFERPSLGERRDAFERGDTNECPDCGEMIPDEVLEAKAWDFHECSPLSVTTRKIERVTEHWRKGILTKDEYFWELMELVSPEVTGRNQSSGVSFLEAVQNQRDHMQHERDDAMKMVELRDKRIKELTKILSQTTMDLRKLYVSIEFELDA